MKGTLFLLCILLVFWIGGSSYWHVYRIKVRNIEQQATQEKNNAEEVSAKIDEPEIDVAGRGIVTKPVKTPEMLDSLEIATKYILENPSRTIYFNYARYEAELSTEDHEYLNKLRLFLENQPDKLVYVIGHSDTSGTPEGLIYASDQRVKFVSEEMVRYGIPSSRIKTQSLGEGYPAESNLTPEGRAKNRRVEITLTKFEYHE